MLLNWPNSGIYSCISFFLLPRVHIWFPNYTHLVKELIYLYVVLFKLVLMSEHYLVCFSTGVKTCKILASLDSFGWITYDSLVFLLFHLYTFGCDLFNEGHWKVNEPASERPKTASEFESRVPTVERVGSNVVTERATASFVWVGTWLIDWSLIVVIIIEWSS